MHPLEKPIPLFTAYNSPAMTAATGEVLQSGQIAAGRFVEAFRAGFATLVGQEVLVTTGDMSGAILLALRLAGVARDDEVLTTAYNCMSSTAPISWIGARPAWVDVDPTTGLMDPEALRRAITPRTKACLVYHAAGYPAPIEEIAEICAQAGIPLIEDCNNALLATVNGRQVGSFGDYAVHSFYPNRQINTAEGGALSCRRPEDMERAVKLRRFGIDPKKFRDPIGEIDPRCDIEEIGWSTTLNNLCSALGLAQLDTVEERLRQTRGNASTLTALLSGLDGVEFVPSPAGCVPAYWGLLLRMQERDSVLAKLKSAGVMASKLHHRIDQYSGFGVKAPPELPGTAQFMSQVLALPCGWWLSSEDIQSISKTLNDAVQESKATS